MNKKIIIPIIIYIALGVFTLLQSRDSFVDEAFSTILTTQYPITFWLAQHPILFILSTYCFYKAAKNAEMKEYKTTTLYAALAVILLTASNVNPKDAHPPLYPLILHAWTQILGTNLIILRSLSLIIGLFSIIALWHYCTKWHNQKTALFATILFAASSTQLHYFTEIRQYSILILLGILATHQLRLIIQEKENPWLYIILATTMLYLHYFTAIFLLSHIIILTIHKTRWNTITKTITPIIITTTPLMYYFLIQKSRIVTMYLKPPTAISWLSSINFALNYPDNLLGTLTPALIPLTILTLTLITTNAVKKNTAWAWSELFLATTPQLFIILIACFYNIYNPRYTLYLLWLIPVLIAAATIHHAQTHPRIAYATYAIILLTTLTFTITTLPNKELQTCTQTLIHDANGKNITILHETPFSTLPATYYTRNHPEIRHVTYFKGYTNMMKNSMNGDVIKPENTIYRIEDLPHIDYYYEHDQYINTHNMTLIQNCNGLHLWRTNPS